MEAGLRQQLRGAEAELEVLLSQVAVQAQLAVAANSELAQLGACLRDHEARAQRVGRSLDFCVKTAPRSQFSSR